MRKYPSDLDANTKRVEQAPKYDMAASLSVKGRSF